METRAGHKKFVWGVVLLGIALRTAQYFSGRSLWFDESLLALNIVGRDYAQLLHALDFHQAAPIGFLWVEKLATQVLSASDFALRLFPYLCGVGALFLFKADTEAILQPGASLLALGLFSLSGPLVYYSSEAKQYSPDVFVELLILGLGLLAEKRTFKLWQCPVVGIFAGSFIWISHPAVFTLAGVLASLILFNLARKEMTRAWRLSLLSLFAVSGLAAAYFLSFRSLLQSTTLMTYWEQGFAPLPLTFSGMRWYLSSFFEMFEGPAGLTLKGLSAFCFLMGCQSMLRKDRLKFGFLVLPLAFALLASGLHLYPFSGRLLLFATPPLFMLLAEGTEAIGQWTHRHSLVVKPVLIILLFLHPVFSAVGHLANPFPNTENIRPVLDYVRKNLREGDRIYLYYGAYFAFKYYQGEFRFRENDVLVGTEARHDWKACRRDLERLHGQAREWVIFSHVYKSPDVNEEWLFRTFLDDLGERLDSIQTTGASAYLYDLSQPLKAGSDVDES